MADEELTKDEERLWKYIQKYDFEENPWSTPDAAKELKMKEDDVYNTLSELLGKLKGKMFIYYKNGAIRIQTD
jgi:hypothetical protein